MEADHPHLPQFLRERADSSPGISARHQDLGRVKVVGATVGVLLATNNYVDLERGNKDREERRERRDWLTSWSEVSV